MARDVYWAMKLGSEEIINAYNQRVEPTQLAALYGEFTPGQFKAVVRYAHQYGKLPYTDWATELTDAHQVYVLWPDRRAKELEKLYQEAVK